jgi:hypothetical protein
MYHASLTAAADLASWEVPSENQSIYIQLGGPSASGQLDLDPGGPRCRPWGASVGMRDIALCGARPLHSSPHWPSTAGTAA